MARTPRSSTITNNTVLQHERWASQPRWSSFAWTTNRRSCQLTTWHEVKAACVTPRCRVLSTPSMGNHLLARYEHRSKGTNCILWDLSQVRNQQPKRASDAAWSAQLTMGTSSWPVWAKQKRIHGNCGLLQQLLGGRLPHKCYFSSHNPETQKPFCMV